MSSNTSSQSNTAESNTSVASLFDMTGQTVLITGASGFLGSAMSQAVAEAGATVVVTSRDQQRAQQTAAALPGGPHFGVALDQLDEASIDAGFQAAVDAAGKIDVLINNGQQGHALDLTNVTAEAFTKDLQNATGYFLLARKLRDHVVSRRGSGSIVMIGSMYGVVGSYPDAYQDICVASPVQYHTLKGGIIHMTRHLAVYWAKDNIRVNCLSPGPFPSEKAPAEMVARLTTKSPMGRTGVPSELKGPLLLLASPAGSYITGQNLLVDGGWTAW